MSGFHAVKVAAQATSRGCAGAKALMRGYEEHRQRIWIMPIQKFCAVLYMALAAIGVANADDFDVTLWIGWSVLHSDPIFEEEKKHNIKHETWNAWFLSNSEAQCEARFRAYGKQGGDEDRMCKPVGLSKDDFDHDSRFAVCSHLQPGDVALHMGNDSYEPLVSMCDGDGQDREWVSRGVQWYESHPLTQSCPTWWRRHGPTFAEVSGNQITREGAAHASTAQSIAAVRAEVVRRAATNDLAPGASKTMSAEQIKSWQNREAEKKIASDTLHAMNDGALESWIDRYCTENPVDTLRDGALVLFSELRRSR